MWDPKRFFLCPAFKEHVRTVACETMRGERTDPIEGFVYPPLWWTSREIRVSWAPTIHDRTVACIVAAVHERMGEFLDPSTFVLVGNHPVPMHRVEVATVRGELDERCLFERSLVDVSRDPGRGGRQHADLYITSLRFRGDPVSRGAASFRHGAMVFCLPGRESVDMDFLRRLALHETNHLLGMFGHCDDHRNVEGLPYTSACNAHYECACADLCPKCRTFIEAWWSGVIEEAHRMCRR